MSHHVYYEFFQTPEQVRRVGARGGRATARNRRDRLDGSTGTPELQCDPPAAVEYEAETVASAIAVLDAEFPWLRGAERGGARR